MELEQLRQNMKKILSKSRYQHILGVEDVSYDLALLYGCNTQSASIGGILHDCAKSLTDEELLKECRKYHIPVTNAEQKSVYLLHAKVGAAYAKDKYEVEEEDILHAISYHTTGRPGMTLLEKIIFTADFIEPNRKIIPNLFEIRKTAYGNLDLAVFMILGNTLQYLKNSNAVIDPRTTQTYEYYEIMNKKV
jgi:predicted HD superfamily hydrolase involved in NAD metabolism